jgi:hypothetical protein
MLLWRKEEKGGSLQGSFVMTRNGDSISTKSREGRRECREGGLIMAWIRHELCCAAQDMSKPIARAAPEEQARKYRHQFFQTPSTVEVDVLAKNLTRERVDLTIEESFLRVVIKSADREMEYDLPVELYDKVQASSW